jgi:hypothetical protein
VDVTDDADDADAAGGTSDVAGGTSDVTGGV